MSCRQCGAGCQGRLCRQCEIERQFEHHADEVASSDPWDQDDAEGDDDP